MESKIIEIIAVFFIVLFVLVIHELGHLIAGLLQGFRFELFVVGPLGIKREDDKIKVYFNKNLGFYGGVAATLPVDDNPNNINKYANLILAGPIASLLLAIICFSFVYFFNFTEEKLLVIAGAASIGIFFATTIPSKTGAFFTDRKRYQRLLSNSKDRKVEMALLRILGIYSRDNNSYKNVNINDIDLVTEDLDYKYFGLSMKLTYEYEIEGSFNVETKLSFDEMTPKMPKSFVKVVAMELKKLEQANI